MVIQEYEDVQFDPLFKLFKSYFQPDDRLLTEHYTRWLYAENPFGLARMVQVREGDRWVGFMAMIPVELVKQGAHLRGYYVVNVLVHPQHLGKHLFGRMISAAKKYAEAENAVLIGHPNDMALKSWQRARMQFHEPLRPSLAIPKPWRIGLAVHREKSLSQLATATHVLADAVGNAKVWRVAATPEYLDWRYLRHPTNAYAVQSLQRAGELVGIQITKWVRLGVGLLVDQFVQPQHVNTATGKLPLLTICFLPDSVTRERSGSVWVLPWKKRIPFFMTHTPQGVESASAASLGLSPSDF